MGVKKKKSSYERRKTVNGKHVGRKDVVRPAILAKLVIQHDGVISECARRLGVSRQAVLDYLKRHPEVQSQIDDARLLAMSFAGLSRVKSYQRIAEGQDAEISIIKINPAPTKENPNPVIITKVPNDKERRLNTVVALQLFGDLKEETKVDMHALIQLYAPQKDKLPTEVIDAATS